MSAELTTQLLRNIKELDSLIDFSRATLQLNIVLTLSNSINGLTAEDIALRIGCRRKPILDALRKLEIKGLIVRKGDIFELSDLGIKYLEQLRTLLRINKSLLKNSNLDVRETAHKLIFYGTLKDIVLILGKEKEATLEKLSKALGISARKTRNYIVYLNNMTKNNIVKSIRRKRLLGTKRVYVLTSYGRKIYKAITIVRSGNAAKKIDRTYMLKTVLLCNVIGLTLSLTLLFISNILALIALSLIVLLNSLVIYLNL